MRTGAGVCAQSRIVPSKLRSGSRQVLNPAPRARNVTVYGVRGGPVPEASGVKVLIPLSDDVCFAPITDARRSNSPPRNRTRPPRDNCRGYRDGVAKPEIPI